MFHIHDKWLDVDAFKTIDKTISMWFSVVHSYYCSNAKKKNWSKEEEKKNATQKKCFNVRKERRTVRKSQRHSTYIRNSTLHHHFIRVEYIYFFRVDWISHQIVSSGKSNVGWNLKKCEHQWFVQFECYAKFTHHIHIHTFSNGLYSHSGHNGHS